MEPTRAEDERCFYHSFPRRRILETDELAIAKGLQLLEAIKRIGLILAPEVVEWSVPLSDGSTKTIRYRQMRMCFTELSSSELPKHGETFGLFSVKIRIDVLRQLGALPVLYMPQMIRGDRLFSSFGPIMVWMIEMARHTLDQLHTLSTLSDPVRALEMTQQTRPDALRVDPSYTLNLTNTTETGATDKVFEVQASVVRGILDFLSYKTAPFELMRGALYSAQMLFYPTDDTRKEELLSYYRQREWRIIPGLTAEGKLQVRPATGDEKDFLVNFDQRFWTRELADDKGSFRRIDEACVLDEFQGKHISDLIEKVIVPPPALAKAREIFGDRAEIP